MRNSILFTFFIFIFSVANAQKPIQQINKEAFLFETNNAKDKIQFLVLDNNLDSVKPILLYFQGSQSRPLYIEYPEGLAIFGSGLDMMDRKYVSKNYRLVVIAMPGTPVVAKAKELSPQYWYDPNHDDMPEKEFLEGDYLENYVLRGNKVIDFLKKQKWVDCKNIVVFGHSQGTKVAARIASKRKDLKAVGLFSPNPYGRIDQYIREDRKDAEAGRMTWEDADRDINKQYEAYKKMLNAQSTNVEERSRKSFSQPQVGDWLKINVPLYVAYGTSDIVADLCDLMPLEFIRNHKTNLTLKRYFNRDHSFFDVDKDGNVNHDVEHFGEVINSFVDWTLSIR